MFAVSPRKLQRNLSSVVKDDDSVDEAVLLASVRDAVALCSAIDGDDADFAECTDVCQLAALIATKLLCEAASHVSVAAVLCSLVHDNNFVQLEHSSVRDSLRVVGALDSIATLLARAPAASSSILALLHFVENVTFDNAENQRAVLERDGFVDSVAERLQQTAFDDSVSLLVVRCKSQRAFTADQITI